MFVLGFGYDEILSSEVPLSLEFNEDQQNCAIFYTTMINENNTFAIIKNEAILKEDMNVLFMCDVGLIQSIITKIDYKKHKIKVGKTWLSEKDNIMTIGINNSNFTDEEIAEEFEDNGFDI